jgi:hypothetical protein
MALPKSVVLDSSTYTVVPMSQPEMDRVMSSVAPDGAIAGCIQYRQNAIYLVTDKVNSPGRVARNFLHECIHGLIIDSKIPRDLNEETTIHLESKLAAFIKNNPKVIKYLQETL